MTSFIQTGLYYGTLVCGVKCFKESKERIEIMSQAMEDMRNQTWKERRADRRTWG